MSCSYHGESDIGSKTRVEVPATRLQNRVEAMKNNPPTCLEPSRSACDARIESMTQRWMSVSNRHLPRNEAGHQWALPLSTTNDVCRRCHSRCSVHGPLLILLPPAQLARSHVAFNLSRLLTPLPDPQSGDNLMQSFTASTIMVRFNCDWNSQGKNTSRRIRVAAVLLVSMSHRVSCRRHSTRHSGL